MEEQKYRITPKGWLMARLNLPGHNMSPKEMDELWSDFKEMVRKQAEANGFKTDLPVLVFDNKGGTCITTGNRTG